MTDYKPNPNGYAALERALAFGLLNLGFAIEGDAKQNCPYKTGNLRRSIHSALFLKGARIYGGTDDNAKPIPAYAAAPNATAMVVVGTNAGYGVFVELGTIHMSAQPYLAPALAANRGRASTLVKAGFSAKRASGT
jgi:HK97 gp10 family phage protein